MRLGEHPSEFPIDEHTRQSSDVTEFLQHSDRGRIGSRSERHFVLIDIAMLGRSFEQPS
jgi:hypothetical protein